MNYEKNLFNASFSHIYVEDRVANHPMVQKISSHFRDADIIRIRHYKDVFCRRRQDIAAQKHSQSLILAEKTGELVYKGSRMCQDFDNDNFYYTSCVMNCVFDCEYCYLKGMYPSSAVVIFLNLDDIFDEVSRLSGDRPVYLCVSYDTDLIALDNLTGYTARWAEFTSKTPNLSVEIRTKSGRCDIYDSLSPCERLIFAYTLSPDSVIDKYEHGTASLSARINAAAYAIKRGFSVRLCFDPMIYCQNYETEYRRMVESAAAVLDFGRLRDISLGSFRISKEYIKAMRHSYPDSPVCQFPYETVRGICQYPAELKSNMEDMLFNLLSQHIDTTKIYRMED